MLPTLLGSRLVQQFAPRALAKDLLPTVADGRATLAVALDVGGLGATRVDDGWVLSGEAATVLGGAGVDRFVVGAAVQDGEVWLVLDAVDVSVAARASLDGTRPV
ncbi:MAG: acyl-CoA dehydrogenase, partial [Actinobacteria bacterium]|nr:acyl-CoA dehydrogenase [Actinomycetota bacterium]NIU68340.1 acyl-CoA dehydrogenase [Actinomycetota bacterium]NIW30163.1 acyl-CoA dehydrogenase [Actinomycetota bacterium]NIX22580.1 acyl-CoA dehydrogenase [Actinomycetota bacterium]